MIDTDEQYRQGKRVFYRLLHIYYFAYTRVDGRSMPDIPKRDEARKILEALNPDEFFVGEFKDLITACLEQDAYHLLVDNLYELKKEDVYMAALLGQVDNIDRFPNKRRDNRPVNREGKHFSGRDGHIQDVDLLGVLRYLTKTSKLTGPDYEHIGYETTAVSTDFREGSMAYRMYVELEKDNDD